MTLKKYRNLQGQNRKNIGIYKGKIVKISEFTTGNLAIYRNYPIFVHNKSNRYGKRKNTLAGSGRTEGRNIELQDTRMEYRMLMGGTYL